MRRLGFKKKFSPEFDLGLCSLVTQVPVHEYRPVRFDFESLDRSIGPWRRAPVENAEWRRPRCRAAAKCLRNGTGGGVQPRAVRLRWYYEVVWVACRGSTPT